MTIEIITGDITEQPVDAIVNAANESLLAGGGVCGAIHRAAGPEMEIACRSLGRCPTGSAVITPGFRLKAKHVIHAVGPRWLGGARGEPELLESCYRSVFDIVEARGLRSVALPAISTGIYNYPLEAATTVAVKVAREYDSRLGAAIMFICFGSEAAQTYLEQMEVT